MRHRVAQSPAYAHGTSIMSALTSLLARDQAVPVRKIEEALQRQVVSGGDISSVLLEIDALGENALAAYQSALFGLLPATRDEVMRVPRDQIRLVPREVAEKHRLVPLAVDGRALIVAMAAPLDHDVEAQLGFLLGYELVVRIVCEVRVAAALLHHYGVEPPARLRRLIEHLRHREAGPVPYVAPPEHAKLSLGSRGIISKKVSASAWLDDPDEPEPPPPPPPPRLSSMPPAAEGRTTDPMGVPRSQVEAALLGSSDLSADAWSAAPPAVEARATLPELPPDPAPPAPGAHGPVDGRATSPYGRPIVHPPLAGNAEDIAAEGRLAVEPGAAAEVLAVSTSSSSPAVPAVKTGDRLSVAPIVGVGVRRSSYPPHPRVGSERRPIVEPIIEPEPDPALRATLPDTRPRPPSAPESASAAQPASGDSSATQERPARAARERRAPKLRGPLTAAQAAKLLDEVTERDAILDVFFAFARQFFDYAALFAVTDDHADGRDAFGEGAPAAVVRALSLSLAGEQDSLLSAARRSALPQLARLATDSDADLAALLERPRDAFALGYPVVIRGRVVLLLYGDRSGDPFELTDVPELVGFVLRVADALEKLILRGKGAGARAGFEKSSGESREALKVAASSLRKSSIPPSRSEAARREDSWGTARTGPAGRTGTTGEMNRLVDAIAAAGLSAPAVSEASLPSPEAASARTLPDPSGELVAPTPPVDGAADLAAHALAESESAPSASEAFRPTVELARPLPPETAVAPRRATRRQTMREVLGIPRAAPPPPVVDAELFGPVPEGDAANEVLLGSTADASGLEALAEVPHNTIPAPPPDATDDSPELVVSSGDGGEDGATEESSDPELVVASADEDDGDATLDDEPEAPIALETRARRSGPNPSYLMRDAGVDGVGRVSSRRLPPAAERRPSQPAGAAENALRPGRRHDPRREDDGPTRADVVAASRHSHPTPDPRFPHGRPLDAFAKSAVIEASTHEGAKPTHDREVPSVIIDMGENTHALVENLMHADPEGDIPSVDALLGIGQVALPALPQAFPGPLWFDRRRNYRKLPRGRDVSAVSRALVAFRERAAPYVGALAGAGSPDRRFYAVMVAAEIPSGALVDPLVQRVFDEDLGVRSLVLEVLPKFRGFSEIQDQLVFLRRTARIRGKEPVRRLYALAALAALRDSGALRMLVDLLEDEDAAVGRAAHAALVTITCEDLGDSSRRWAAWAEKNESHHRIEWLIDALLSSEEPLRGQAGEELKNITQQYFGYHPGSSRKEREVVQAKYRAWWESDGRALFK